MAKDTGKNLELFETNSEDTKPSNDIELLMAAFEAAAQRDEAGVEYWRARTLQTLLGYSDYRNFLNTVEKAKLACITSGHDVFYHFVDVTEMVELGSDASRRIDDIQLSRYACYLITQNGDARKKPIAIGQTYFAIQTRRQELQEKEFSPKNSLPESEDAKRVMLRDQVKDHNRALASAAKAAGVRTSQDYAVFQTKGYQGLYEKTVPEIRKHRKLSAKADILDHMGSTELAANFFRVTQTEEKLRKENIKTRTLANDTHYAVGRQVREAMLKISGIAPENLPLADPIKQAKKRLELLNKAENLAVSNQKIVDEITNDAISERTHNKSPHSLPSQDLHPVKLHNDLWKFALLLMALRQDGIITTTSLIKELPNYIQIPQEELVILQGRKDSKFSQRVRNLKSHKTATTNFIAQGFAEDMRGGFRITDKGRLFVKTYFASIL